MNSPRKFCYIIPFILQKIGYILSFTALKIFVRIEIRGKQNLEGISGPIIIASNHTSELDVLAIPLIFPMWSRFHPIFFVANQSEKYKKIGWRGTIYSKIVSPLLGAYASNSGSRNYEISLKDHVELLREGHTLCIFPEGKRTLTGIISPARGGLGYLMHATKATVMPIAINTFFEISAFDFFMRRRKVIISIAPPIHDELKKEIPSIEDYHLWSQSILNKVSHILKD